MTTTDDDDDDETTMTDDEEVFVVFVNKLTRVFVSMAMLIVMAMTRMTMMMTDD